MPSSSTSGPYSSTTRRFVAFVGPQYAPEAHMGTAPAPADPTFCQWLEPIFISVPSGPEQGEARLIADAHFDDVFFNSASPYYLKPDQQVMILDFDLKPAAPRYTFDDSIVVFRGLIKKIRVSMQGEQEYTEVILYQEGTDYLNRMCVHGQVRYGYDTQVSLFGGDGENGYIVSDQDLVISDEPTIFNPDGRGNCSSITVAYTPYGGSRTYSTNVFEVPNWQPNVTIPDGEGTISPSVLASDKWTVQKVINYLFAFHPTEWFFADFSTHISDFFTANPDLDAEVNNLNIEGKDLLTAFTMLLSPFNIVFSVIDRSIIFSRRGDQLGATITYTLPSITLEKEVVLCLSERGTQFKLSVAGDQADNGYFNTGSNLIAMDMIYDTSNVVNQMTVFGDYEFFTTLAHTNPNTSSSSSGGSSAADFQIMKLVPAWEPTMLQFPSVLYVGGPKTTNINIWGTTSSGKKFHELYCQDPNLITTITSGSSSSSGKSAYGVGRLWLVNCGETPDNDLVNISSYFRNNYTFLETGRANMVRGNGYSPRKFEKPAIFETNGEDEGSVLGVQQDIFVEMTVNGGQTWFLVPRKYYRVLPSASNFNQRDSMGIIFHELDLLQMTRDAVDVPLEVIASSSSATSPTSYKNYWTALYESISDGVFDPNGPLQIRIIAGVKSNTKLALDISPYPSSSSGGSASYNRLHPPLMRQRVYENNGFKSFYFNSYIDQQHALYKLSNMNFNAWAYDDRIAIGQAGLALIDYQSRPLHTGQIALLLDYVGQYLPGMTITSIQPRDLDFDPKPTILKVIYDLKSRHVHLTVDSNMIRPVLGKHYRDENGVNAGANVNYRNKEERSIYRRSQH